MVDVRAGDVARGWSSTPTTPSPSPRPTTSSPCSTSPVSRGGHVLRMTRPEVLVDGYAYGSLSMTSYTASALRASPRHRTPVPQQPPLPTSVRGHRPSVHRTDTLGRPTASRSPRGSGGPWPRPAAVVLAARRAPRPAPTPVPRRPRTGRPSSSSPVCSSSVSSPTGTGSSPPAATPWPGCPPTACCSTPGPSCSSSRSRRCSNLDTSVTFLTPVLVYAARSRGEGEAPLLYGCLLLSNAGSLLLPGSNLTNLIVLGHLHLSGGAFFAHMALPALAAAARHRRWSSAARAPPRPAHDRRGRRPSRNARSSASGLVAVGASSPSWSWRCARRRSPWPRSASRPCSSGRRAAAATPATRPGRAAQHPRASPSSSGSSAWPWRWARSGDRGPGPATLLAHLDAWGTAAVAALTSVLVNNLPAASLLAARQPPHPFALLIGLNVGPEPVRDRLAGLDPVAPGGQERAGGQPDVRRASLLGVASVPLAIAAAVGVLVLSGSADRLAARRRLQQCRRTRPLATSVTVPAARGRRSSGRARPQRPPSGVSRLDAERLPQHQRRLALRRASTLPPSSPGPSRGRCRGTGAAPPRRPPAAGAGRR